MSSSIDAAAFKKGDQVRIGSRVQIAAIGGPATDVRIGDNVFIGDDVRILAPRVRIDDFAIIHHHTTIYGYDEVTIGSGTWIGQNAILNCTGPLTIGRGCTLSAMCNIWTHFYGGDPVEGSRFNVKKPAVIGDDAWIGVQASIAPVNVGAKALVLAGSVVTKDVAPNTTWGGNPAVDLTAKMGTPFIERPMEEKFEEMCQLLRTYHHSLREVQVMDSGLGDEEFAGVQTQGLLSLSGITVAMTDWKDDGTSVFDVRDRTYSKLRTPEEIGFMNFLLPLVRFYPRLEK